MKRLVVVALLLVVSTHRGFAQQSPFVVVPRWARVEQHDSISRLRVWADSDSRRATWIGVATGAIAGAIAGGFAGDYVSRGLCDLPRDRCGSRGAVLGGAVVGALAGGALGYFIGVMIDEERSARAYTLCRVSPRRVSVSLQFGSCGP